MPSKPPFPLWAKSEIARLRERADALQRALDLYQADEEKPAAVMADRSFASTRHTRVSKYEPLFQQFEQAGRPLSMDDMERVAKQGGFQLDRSNLRSQVFAQKSLGRARPVGTGYLWGLPLEPEASASEIEEAA